MLKISFESKDKIDIRQEKGKVSIVIKIPCKKNNLVYSYSRTNKDDDLAEFLFKNLNRKKTVKEMFGNVCCKHYYIPFLNSHGDIINILKKRTYVICAKCGRGKWIEKYIESPFSYSFAGIEKKNYNY